MMLVLVIDPSVYIIIHQEEKPGAHLTKSWTRAVAAKTQPCFFYPLEKQYYWIKELVHNNILFMMCTRVTGITFFMDGS